MRRVRRRLVREDRPVFTERAQSPRRAEDFEPLMNTDRQSPPGGACGSFAPPSRNSKTVPLGRPTRAIFCWPAIRFCPLPGHQAFNAANPGNASQASALCRLVAATAHTTKNHIRSPRSEIHRPQQARYVDHQCGELHPLHHKRREKQNHDRNGHRPSCSEPLQSQQHRQRTQRDTGHQRLQALRRQQETSCQLVE